MRAITKGPEPATLQAYRAVPGATYDGKDFTPIKSDIRAALLRDQHALCCYCMRRISSEERPHPTRPDTPPVVQMKVKRETDRLIARYPKQPISRSAIQQQIAEAERPAEGRLREHACLLRLWARKRNAAWNL